MKNKPEQPEEEIHDPNVYEFSKPEEEALLAVKELRIRKYIESNFIAIEELKEKIEKMKKKKLYHWVIFEDEFSEGIVADKDDAPIESDLSSCEYVYNEALEDILKELGL